MEAVDMSDLVAKASALGIKEKRAKYECNIQSFIPGKENCPTQWKKNSVFHHRSKIPETYDGKT
jgi:hypothetical protein